MSSRRENNINSMGIPNASGIPNISGRLVFLCSIKKGSTNKIPGILSHEMAQSPNVYRKIPSSEKPGGFPMQKTSSIVANVKRKGFDNNIVKSGHKTC